jgi:hypothetical protein
MFIFKRPFAAVAAGLAVAFITVWLDRQSQPSDASDGRDEPERRATVERAGLPAWRHEKSEGRPAQTPVRAPGDRIFSP